MAATRFIGTRFVSTPLTPCRSRLLAVPMAQACVSMTLKRFQSVAARDKEESITAAIDNDHRYINGCYDNIKNTRDLDVKDRWRNQLVWSWHSVSEELTVYPEFEKLLGKEGRELADDDRFQHQMVRDDLAQVQDMDPDDSRFNLILESLMKNLNSHIKKEMHEDMPKLESKLTKEDSASLARSFQRTKMITPTRAHPMAPNTPFLESVVSLMTMPIDRIRDWMRTFPDDVPPEDTRPVPDAREQAVKKQKF